MTCKQQDSNWHELSYNDKYWVYDHYRQYWNYKISRSPLIAFLDGLFGSPYDLEENMIKEYGKHNIRNFKYD